ncbi:hypothetical protein [Vibrio coralliilyticus]|uniref:DUF2321 domain-containing protein n=1 Tax=Vibrio coralliilyticus TaxID=190893 RepID=A0AAP6ZNJ2_9VIBR|nr:hypothetical protein [Vibrio coralliilyticus]NOI32252.1 hypothetical protein [Vibrio coralliilyticus]NOJ25336.1 hypothetical protein [Vibrio coralliilyticus]
MCNKLINNRSGNYFDKSDLPMKDPVDKDGWNAFIIENVLDTKGFKNETECPNCGKNAERRNFDECLGGTINQVYSIDCSHCGYHKCDQEECYACEVIYNQKHAAQSRHLGEAIEADLMLDSMIESLEKDGRIEPATLTYLKLKLTNKDVQEHFELVFVPKGTKANQYIKRKLLDALFFWKNEQMIEQAKMELA